MFPNMEKTLQYFAFICIVSLSILAVSSSEEISSEKVKSLLKNQKIFSGSVFTAQSSEKKFNEFRKQHNGACDRIVPLVVARPRNSRDVSVAVKLARQFDIPLSVRGGGHSFSCSMIKADSLHLDMRRLNKVQLLPHTLQDGKTDYMLAKLGAGNDWGHVLEILPRSNYSMVHGNAFTVGIGGFLLGGGFGPTGGSAKYGIGSDNVAQYTMVLADGNIAVVNRDNVTTMGIAGNNKVVPNTPESDLFTSMQKSGMSYGIVTEFLYKVYPVPEIMGTVVPVIINSFADLDKFRVMNQLGKYDIVLSNFHNFYEFRNDPDALQSDRRQIMTSVYDLTSTNGKTSAQDVVDLYHKFEVETSFDNVPLIHRADALQKYGLENQDPMYISYEHVVMPQEDIDQLDVNLGIVSASYLKAKSYDLMARVILDDPVLGTRKTGEDTGCEMCYYCFFSHEGKKYFESPVEGSFTIEVMCVFDPKNTAKKSRCIGNMNNIKSDLNKAALKKGEKLYQYSNTPSCSKKDRPFTERYFGSKYDLLLRTKKAWDPENIINSCQSVGSTEQNCCVY